MIIKLKFFQKQQKGGLTLTNVKPHTVLLVNYLTYGNTDGISRTYTTMFNVDSLTNKSTDYFLAAGVNNAAGTELPIILTIKTAYNSSTNSVVITTKYDYCNFTLI